MLNNISNHIYWYAFSMSSLWDISNWRYNIYMNFTPAIEMSFSHTHRIQGQTIKKHRKKHCSQIRDLLLDTATPCTNVRKWFLLASSSLWLENVATSTDKIHIKIGISKFHQETWMQVLPKCAYVSKTAAYTLLQISSRVLPSKKLTDLALSIA